MSASLRKDPGAHPFPETESDALTDSRHGDSGVFRLSDLEQRARLESRREDHFERFGALVRRIAVKAARSLPRSITLDDIVSAGWVGMSEAIHRRPFAMPDEQFEAYASYRIRGAILDYLRALDPLSRSLRSAAREIQRATRAVGQREGRSPEQEEIAEQLHMPLNQLQRLQADIQEAAADRVELGHSPEAPSSTPSPESLASHNQMMLAISEQARLLPERLQVVLNLHYQHECSLREIGEILGVTESRVCQLRAEAVQRLRARLVGRSTGA